jgi:hypothetical protein
MLRILFVALGLYSRRYIDSGIARYHQVFLMLVDKHSSLLRSYVNCGRKKSYKIGARQGDQIGHFLPIGLLLDFMIF